MLNLYEEFRALIANLSERGVDYALCGGLAMAVYGLARATADIDLLVPAESAEGMTALAQELGYTVVVKPMKVAAGALEIRRLSKLDPASGDVLVLDLLLVTPAMADVWESRTEVEWENQRLRIVSRDGLITLKSLRGSGQDLDDIKRLREAPHGS